MLNDYEQFLLNTYLANTAASLTRQDPVARQLIDWVSDRENRIRYSVCKWTAVWEIDSVRQKTPSFRRRRATIFNETGCRGAAIRPASGY